MKAWILSLFRWIMGTPEEVYIGETPLFQTHQITLERYSDFKPMGQWGCTKVDDDGNVLSSEIMGEMCSETVKFVGKDGKTKLGTDWVAIDQNGNRL